MKRHTVALMLVAGLTASQSTQFTFAGGDHCTHPWSIVIARPGESGERMVVSGTVYGADGSTPAAGVTVYVYHTDARGYYNEGKPSGTPRLRGWMTTDVNGRYEFRTIKPAAYPGRKDPAHIHVKALGGGYPEQYLDDYVFDDDPLVTDEERSKQAGKGTLSAIVKLQEGSDGNLYGKRDLKLKIRAMAN